MGLLEKIYDRSPIFFQNIMVSVSGYQRNVTRYGKAYYDYLKFLSDFDTWPLERKLEYQRQELIKFIRYAVSNSNSIKNYIRMLILNLSKILTI